VSRCQSSTLKVPLLTASNARLLFEAYLPTSRGKQNNCVQICILEGVIIIEIHETTRSLFRIRGEECMYEYDVRPLLAVINSESLPKFNTEGAIVDRYSNARLLLEYSNNLRRAKQVSSNLYIRGCYKQTATGF